MIFSKEFKKVMNTMRCCLDNEERQVSDLDIETFRQKHQEISMTVSHVDDCLMFSTASAFCCQLFCFILLLYMLIFYHSVTTDPVLIISQVFWMFLFSFGLTLTAGGAIYVHHYVSLFCVCLILCYFVELFSSIFTSNGHIKSKSDELLSSNASRWRLLNQMLLPANAVMVMPSLCLSVCVCLSVLCVR